MITPTDLYNALDNAKLDYEVVENFEGLRTINFLVDEDEDEDEDEEEEREWVGTIRMRWDLAENELSVPASTTFSNYDTLDDDIFVTAEELEGAEQGDDPADPDDHAFCYVKLKDGRSLYFMSVDLDFKSEESVDE